MSKQTLLYSFSLGAFMLAVLCAVVSGDTDKYGGVIRRVIGVVFDSAAIGKATFH